MGFFWGVDQDSIVKLLKTLFFDKVRIPKNGKIFTLCFGPRSQSIGRGRISREGALDHRESRERRDKIFGEETDNSFFFWTLFFGKQVARRVPAAQLAGHDELLRPAPVLRDAAHAASADAAAAAAHASHARAAVHAPAPQRLRCARRDTRAAITITHQPGAADRERAGLSGDGHGPGCRRPHPRHRAPRPRPAHAARTGSSGAGSRRGAAPGASAGAAPGAAPGAQLTAATSGRALGCGCADRSASRSATAAPSTAFADDGAAADDGRSSPPPRFAYLPLSRWRTQTSAAAAQPWAGICFRPPTHFSHMSHPTFPISHLLFLFSGELLATRRQLAAQVQSTFLAFVVFTFVAFSVPKLLIFEALRFIR